MPGGALKRAQQAKQAALRPARTGTNKPPAKSNKATFLSSLVLGREQSS